MKWWGLVLPSVLPACALFLDTDGLSGEGAAPDAGSATDGSSSSTDAPSRGDATLEADAPPFDAPIGGCRDGFFDSFDDGDLGAKWDNVTQIGASLALVQAAPRSAPNALLVTVTDPFGKAWLSKKLTTSKDVCCEIAISGYSDYLSLFRIDGRGGNYNVHFSFGSGSFGVAEKLYVADGSPANYDRDLGELAVPSSGWTLLRFQASLPSGPGKGTLRITSNGVPALTSAIGSDTESVAFDELFVGITYTENTIGAKVRYDDVGCTFR